MKAETELYLAATNLVNTYIRLHPGPGRWRLGDTALGHDIVVLDLTPWLAPSEPDVSRLP